MSAATFKIQIQGFVQGVGFRPFIYRLAQQMGLQGYVSNNAQGVVILLNATESQAEEFIQSIYQNKPAVSQITAHGIEQVEAQHFDDFTILPSETKASLKLPLTPDFALCANCQSEMMDPENRRFGYAFTTCVHCGPRYAITTAYPFDRANTSMHEFTMCTDCQSEYNDPTNRRFHSQTNSCPNCGPSLQLLNTHGELLSQTHQDCIKQAAQFIAEGKIVAVQSTNGYVLCCDAHNVKAINTLRRRKQRPDKPFAVLYSSLEAIQNEFSLNESESKQLQSVVAPIVILTNTERTTIATEAIAPQLDQTGVMLPQSAVLFLLMQTVHRPIVATSGNSHGSPIISQPKQAHERLASVADYFLEHNLPIQFPQDDSLYRFAGNQPIVLRRSRGLAPSYLKKISSSAVPILAMGAQLKSTIAFRPNDQLYVSPYLGNLDHFDVVERYQYIIEQYTTLFDGSPQNILIDAHPQYQSSLLGKEYAKQWQANVVQIQHHKAHFAAILGEYDLFDTKEKILGVVWDGTGWGDDGAIWGGEFFVYEKQTIERVNHFEYYDWIAGDNMAKEPRLSALSLAFGNTEIDLSSKFSGQEVKLYEHVLANNQLKTSSVGRLFDTVASLLDLVDINSYEAQAAMRLEQAARQADQKEAGDFLDTESYENIPTQRMIQNIWKAKQAGKSIENLAFSLHYSLARLIIREAEKLGITTIACSGGVFQNACLVSILQTLASEHRLDIKFHHQFSPNDENLSFGQMMYVLKVLKYIT